MARFDGMVAIVLGGADNIGRATAAMLARGGARVVVGYHSNVDGAQRTLAQIADCGGEAIAVQVDQACEDQVSGMVRAAVDAFGKINVLINNAASVGRSQDRDLDIVNMDAAYWDGVMAVNLRGPMLACKHCIPHMMAAGYGSIVNTGSGVAFRGDSVRSAYASSKIGLHALTMNVATAYGKHNIRCNLVSPGLVLARTVREMLDPASIASFSAQNLVPFVGEPDDIAHVSCFLASSAARYITGQVIAVDGGMLVHQCSLGQV